MQRETWHLSQATINSREIFCIFLFFNPMPDATRSFLDRAEEGNMLAVIQPYAKIAINIKDPVIYQILFWIYWKKVVAANMSETVRVHLFLLPVSSSVSWQASAI
jgi:hypothetical protein